MYGNDDVVFCSDSEKFRQDIQVYHESSSISINHPVERDNERAGHLRFSVTDASIMMETKLSTRTRILTFDDDISVFLIFADRHTFLCDTHLGPDSMQQVQELLAGEAASRDLVVFNSHSDWDHIWGNCAFPEVMIIGHTTCRERMKERGEFDISRLHTLTRGDVRIILPNLTFESHLCFEDDDVCFIHAPGHTIDSSLCFDRRDGVLYVGDLVEDPVPYLDYERLDTYLETLEMLLTFPANVLVSAHSGIVTRDLIRKNIRYITKVMDGEEIDQEQLGAYASVHLANINTLLMLKYEKVVREKLKESYDFVSFWSITPDLSLIGTRDLTSLLDRYLSGRT